MHLWDAFYLQNQRIQPAHAPLILISCATLFGQLFIIIIFFFQSKESFNCNDFIENWHIFLHIFFLLFHVWTNCLDVETNIVVEKLNLGYTYYGVYESVQIFFFIVKLLLQPRYVFLLFYWLLWKISELKGFPLDFLKTWLFSFYLVCARDTQAKKFGLLMFK